MIRYTLWDTLREKGISQNKLKKEHHVSSGQLDRMRKNIYISTRTVDFLCSILDCPVEDIIEFQADPAFRPELGIIPGQTLLTSPPENGVSAEDTQGAPANPEDMFEDEEPSNSHQKVTK